MNTLINKHLFRFFVGILMAFNLTAVAYSAEIVGTTSPSQSIAPTDPLGSATCVLDLMKDLESARDAKCYATANRLENYMYGTSLTSEARFRKSELQKDLLKKVWTDASELANQQNRAFISRADAEQVFQKYFHFKQDSDEIIRIDSTLPEIGILEIEPRDLRQYGTIAYAFRAILSLQQDAMLDPAFNPVVLDKEASNLMREYLDVLTLAVLNLSNQLSIKQNSAEITKEIFEAAWKAFFDPDKTAIATTLDPTRHRNDFKKITETLIAGKLAAYSKYNKHDQVDIRNKELEFIEKNWVRYPVRGSEAFKKTLMTDHWRNLNAWARILYQDAEFIARERKHALIRPEDMETAVLHLTPHIITDHEDVVFFPQLSEALKIKIEAYDMDAYRDFGFHWKVYQQTVVPHLKRNDQSLFADPFASEIFVEAIAQYGVLSWRVTGMVAQERTKKEDNQEPITLRRAHLKKAITAIQSLGELDIKSVTERTIETNILSSTNSTLLPEQPLFEIDSNTNIDFTYHLPTWRKKWVLETYGDQIFKAFHGTGVGVGDVDGDNIDDLLMLSGDGYQLYRGNGKGNFENITEKSGIQLPATHQDRGEPYQPLMADFDNDGYLDIIITYSYNKHLVFRNRGDATFENLTEQANIGAETDPSVAAIAVDLDNDGLLDLYVTNFGDTVGGFKPTHGTGKEDLDGEIEDTSELRPSQRKKAVTPTLSRNSRNATPNVLYKNMGNFIFKDVTVGSGADDTGWANGAGHTDFDLDGDQDIIVANDFGRNALLRNDGDMKFTDVTLKYGLVDELNSMNVGLSDLNRDGFPDIYFSNINAMNKDEKYTFPEKDMPIHFAEEAFKTTRYVRRSILYMSASVNGNFAGYRISDKVSREQENSGWAWDADFFDADNDGDDDVYVVNGYSAYNAVLNKETKKVEKGKLTTGSTAKHKSIFYLNHDGTLAPQKNDLRISGVSYSAVYIDYDLDGDLDIVINQLEKPAVTIRNNADKLKNHWLKLKLVGDVKSKSNRDAIGTRMYFTVPDGQRIWREVHGGSGYLSFESKTQHIGLGQHDVANVEIIWPNGQKQVIENLAADHTYEVIQNGSVRHI